VACGTEDDGTDQNAERDKDRCHRPQALGGTG
jgi:hypothetical protein